MLYDLMKKNCFYIYHTIGTITYRTKPQSLQSRSKLLLLRITRFTVFQ